MEKSWNQLNTIFLNRMVQTNDKQRFSLKDENGVYFIRANQGHSMKSVEVEMVEIKNANDFPVVVHGTYYQR